MSREPRYARSSPPQMTMASPSFSCLLDPPISESRSNTPALASRHAVVPTTPGPRLSHGSLWFRMRDGLRCDQQFLGPAPGPEDKTISPASLGDLFWRGDCAAQRSQAFRCGVVGIVTQYRETRQEQALRQRGPQQPDPDQPNVFSFCRRSRQNSTRRLNWITRAPRVEVNCPKLLFVTCAWSPLKFVWLNAFNI